MKVRTQEEEKKNERTRERNEQLILMAMIVQ
jgi:hypothetical protein